MEKRDRTWAVKQAVALVRRMTTDEAIGQLMYNSPAIPRLHVPEYNWWNEGLHGVARSGCATMFPQAIGMAASFDEDLMEKTGAVIGREGRAMYNAYRAHGDRGIYKGLTFWSPNVNIFRDPRWGRGQETYGEDPVLSGRLGAAFVKGLQGSGKYLQAAACAKHFAVHSGPEKLRHEFNATASKKDMAETYLPAFKALADADVEGFMGAYNRVNGEPACASRTLMRILRTDWRFEGYFTSDCWAIRDFYESHRVTKTPEQAAAMAVKAGCDLNCGCTYLSLREAYRKHLVTDEEIRRAAVHLFTTRFLLGMFEHTPYDDVPVSEIESSRNIATSRKMAEESIVLLKNNGILPLSRVKTMKIAVVGPNADSREALAGNYHGTSSEYVTALQGIREAASPAARIYYALGSHLYKDSVESCAAPDDKIAEAVIRAEQSQVVIVCTGLDETVEGEQKDVGNDSYLAGGVSDDGDRVSLGLPKSQQRLLRALMEVGRPIIILNFSGSPMDFSEFEPGVAAILQCWYPGAQGGRAIGDILFGKVSPGGKLPVTFPKSLDDLPPFEDYSMKGRTYRYMEKEPAYPFGYGLTYGDIELKGLRFVEDDREKQAYILSAFAMNRGGETDDVLQVYVKPDSPLAPPNPSLVDFSRFHLRRNESMDIRLVIPYEMFQVVNEEGKRVYDGSQAEIFVGLQAPDSRSARLTGRNDLEIVVKLPGQK